MALMPTMLTVNVIDIRVAHILCKFTFMFQWLWMQGQCMALHTYSPIMSELSSVLSRLLGISGRDSSQPVGQMARVSSAMHSWTLGQMVRHHHVWSVQMIYYLGNGRNKAGWYGIPAEMCYQYLTIYHSWAWYVGWCSYSGAGIPPSIYTDTSSPGVHDGEPGNHR